MRLGSLKWEIVRNKSDSKSNNYVKGDNRNYWLMRLPAAVRSLKKYPVFHVLFARKVLRPQKGNRERAAATKVTECFFVAPTIETIETNKQQQKLLINKAASSCVQPKNVPVFHVLFAREVLRPQKGNRERTATKVTECFYVAQRPW